jgi:GNAT superfamily N-acetyltransferase
MRRRFRPLGRDAPARGRGVAGTRCVRGTGAVAAHRRAVPAGRFHPHWAHRGCLPGQVENLPSADAPPLDGLAVRRSVGINGCRFSAVLGEEVIGYIETEVLDKGERMSRHGGWADVGNLHVASPHRRRGVGSWLLGQAADWLRLAGANRLLNYAWLEGTDPGGLNYDDYRAFLSAVGFRELTRTERGWTRE